jgi:hypothetical protein
MDRDMVVSSSSGADYGFSEPYQFFILPVWYERGQHSFGTRRELMTADDTA